MLPRSGQADQQAGIPGPGHRLVEVRTTSVRAVSRRSIAGVAVREWPRTAERSQNSAPATLPTVSQTAPERIMSWDAQYVLTKISAYSPVPSTKRFRAVDLRR